LVSIVLTGSVFSRCAQAQQAVEPPTNLETYQRLAIECLSPMPDSVRAFALDAPASMPYIRSALIGRWTEAGLTVYQADTARTTLPDLPRLQYTIPSAEVSYARLRRRSMQRTIRFAVHKTLTDSQGAILHDDSCQRQSVDSLRIADLERIESTSYPETRAARPEPGWARRIFEPLVLTAATVVSVYLFFTLRSDNADDA
jgi:hypothetical protein